MLVVLHRIEQLVLVGEVAENKVYKAEEKDKDAMREDAVHDADNENEECLWQVEAIFEDWRLHQLSEICERRSATPNPTKLLRNGSLPRGVFAPMSIIGYKETLPN